jgi:hypothetical protein
MAFSHGKDAYISVNAVDISAFTNTVTFSQSADSHDTTTYGQEAHTFADGLTNATVTVGGIYDNGAAGPHDTFQAAIGTGAKAFVWRPEGTGSALPELAGTCIVTGYDETAPVADMISWSANLQVSGTITTTNQT